MAKRKKAMGGTPEARKQYNDYLASKAKKPVAAASSPKSAFAGAAANRGASGSTMGGAGTAKRPVKKS